MNLLRPIKAVFFDFDGTLTRPAGLDFAALRRELGCPPGAPILEYIAGLPAEERRKASSLLDDWEFKAAESAVPNHGAEALLGFLKSRGVPFVIVSRNSRRSIQRALKAFSGSLEPESIPIFSRDDDFPPKPNPEPLMHAAASLGIRPEEAVSIGDFIFDLEAAHGAGCRSVLLAEAGHPLPAWADLAEVVLTDLEECRDWIQLRLPLAEGKLPNELLGRFLGELRSSSPSLLVGPAVGFDAALIELDQPAGQLLLKSDPVTFPTLQPARTVVTINSNDIAAAGGRPRWLLVTILMPPGTLPEQIRRLFAELNQACRQLGVLVCGGHTEITGAVTRPTISAQMTGIVERPDIARRSKVGPGDRILMTRTAGLEGTAILARQRGKDLLENGVSRQTLDRCCGLESVPGFDVLAEALVAQQYQGVTAMHDVTEGGVAVALKEVSLGTGYEIVAEPTRVPVLDETRQICGALGIDPLGLIGSGSLLILVRQDESGTLRESLGVPVEEIGYLARQGQGVRRPDGSPWPVFETDEIVRALGEVPGVS